jgi:hypothetical protein
VNQDNHPQVQPTETGTADEEFEKLRQRFQQRLRQEQAQLSALSEVLGRASIAPASILVEVRAFAHRLRGAALVFGFQEIGEGAKAVELAAIAASLDAKGQRCDPSVVATLRALAINLAAEVGTGAPCPQVGRPILRDIGSSRKCI